MIMLFFVFIQAKAQFNEGFEDKEVFNKEWNIVKTREDGPYWGIYKDELFPKDGRSCAMIVGKATNQKGGSYLITPQIEVIENNTDGFSYWVGSLFNETTPRRYVLKLSEKGKDLDDFEEIVLTESLDKREWKKNTINLKKYIGKKIYLAFYVADLEIGAIRIDNVVNAGLSDVLEAPTFNHEGFEFYPNPTADYLHFSYTKELQAITICNLQGQKMQTKEINALRGSLALLDYPQGIYIAKFTDLDGLEKTIKFVKN